MAIGTLLLPSLFRHEYPAMISTYLRVLGSWVLVLYVLSRLIQNFDTRACKTPTVRFWPWIFPDVMNRLSFNSKAPDLIRKGYLAYKHQPFKVLKPGKDLLVIPLEYGNELRSVHSEKLNQLEANFENHVGDYTSILLGGDLHTEVIQRRLIPGLPRILPSVIDELCHAFREEFPECQDTWVLAQPYKIALGLTSRAGARVFVSKPICRDAKFLETSVSLTANIFETIGILRLVPPVIRPFVGARLPSVKRLNGQLDYVRRLLGSEIERRKTADEGNDDFLQWSTDLATRSEDQDPAAIAHRTMGILSMAVVHTTAMAVTHMLYDLIEQPEALQALVDEQKMVLPNGWSEIDQAKMLKMRLLDSFMRESQRFNPPGEVSFSRVVKEPIQLSDGFVLELGQQICVASRQINAESPDLEHPGYYEPFRWANDEGPTSSWAHSSTHNLHFGLGRYACPGRFFASYMIKSIMSRLLLEYDFKFEDGRTSRPQNLVQGDKILPDYNRRLLFRRRTS